MERRAFLARYDSTYNREYRRYVARFETELAARELAIVAYMKATARMFLVFRPFN